MSPVPWTIVIPVKRLERAKTRLGLPPQQRAELALAMAYDTVNAAMSAGCVARVIVVTDDSRAADALLALGADVVADEPDSGLNSALSHGVAVARAAEPVAVATMSSDLPALRPEELCRVLRAVQSVGAVADRAGTGTTLLAAERGHGLQPLFGDGSFARHTSAGAVDLTGIAGPSLRTDVDTAADLQAVVALGVAEMTTRVLATGH